LEFLSPRTTPNSSENSIIYIQFIVLVLLVLFL